MSPLRARLIVTVLLMAFVGSMASAYTAQGRQLCVVAHHECDEVPTIAECCCGNGGSSVPSVPPEQRVQLGSSVSVATPALDQTITVVCAQTGLPQVCGVSPRACLLDLPTLFSTLLI
jgi:hypothetical protein